MKKFLIVLAIALSVSYTYSNISFAACGGGPTVFTCDTSPPNPDLDGIQEQANDANLTIEMLAGSEIDTRNSSGGNGLEGIATGQGNNNITLNGAKINAQVNAIETETGNDTVKIIDSETAGLNNNTIDLSAGDNVLEIIGSIVTSDDDRVVSMQNGNDIVTIRDSEVKATRGQGLDEAIFTSTGSDTMLVENSLIRGETGGPVGESIDLGSDDDVLTIGNNVVLSAINSEGEDIPGRIDCGSNFDTIVFAMEVPEEQLTLLSAEIAAASLPDGSIVINGLTYTWIRCELLVNQLVGVRNIRPIPTLSEWGLIAMAGVLGLVGFIAVQRRRAAQ